MSDFRFIIPAQINSRDEWWKLLLECWETDSDSMGIKDVIFEIIPADTLFTGIPRKTYNDGSIPTRLQNRFIVDSPVLLSGNIQIPELYDGYQLGMNSKGVEDWLPTGNPNFSDWLQNLLVNEDGLLSTILRVIRGDPKYTKLEQDNAVEFLTESLVVKDGMATLSQTPLEGELTVFITNGITRQQKWYRILGDKNLILPDDIKDIVSDGDLVNIKYKWASTVSGNMTSYRSIRVLQLLENELHLLRIEEENILKIMRNDAPPEVKEEKNKSAPELIYEAMQEDPTINVALR